MKSSAHKLRATAGAFLESKSWVKNISARTQALTFISHCKPSAAFWTVVLA
jgi:hypothetical protein